MSRARLYHHLYDAQAWRKLRRAHLSIEPCCIMCDAIGLTVIANIVDHITPHKGDTTLFYSNSNLQSLCKPCHDSTKKLLETRGYIQGNDIDGTPLDKNSHWHK